MSEPQDPGSRCGQGGEKQDRILQPEYDGGFCSRFGKLAPFLKFGAQLTDHHSFMVAQYQAR